MLAFIAGLPAPLGMVSAQRSSRNTLMRAKREDSRRQTLNTFVREA